MNHQWLIRLGSPAYLSFPGGCQASIDGIVGAGKARFLAFDPPSTSGHPIVDFFAGFESVCRDRGYFYLDQTRNKASRSLTRRSRPRYSKPSRADTASRSSTRWYAASARDRR